MAVKTQGTQLFLMDTPTTVVKIGSIKSISGISASREQRETTDLESTARTYEAGLLAPGAATFEIQFDPSNSTHVTLHDLYKNGTVVKWALGWSDDTTAPTAAAGAFTLPTSRTWLDFDGYITDLPFSFDLNDSVKSSISLQVSGFPNLTAKV